MINNTMSTDILNVLGGIVAVIVIITVWIIMSSTCSNMFDYLYYRYYRIHVLKRHGFISSAETSILMSLAEYREYPFLPLQPTDYESLLPKCNETYQWLPNDLFRIVLEYKDAAQPIEYNDEGKGIEVETGYSRPLMNVRDASTWRRGYCGCCSINRILIPLYFSPGVPMKFDLTIRSTCGALECVKHIPAGYIFVDISQDVKNVEWSRKNLEMLDVFADNIRRYYGRAFAHRRIHLSVPGPDPIRYCYPDVGHKQRYHMHIRDLPPNLLLFLHDRNTSDEFVRVRVEVRINIHLVKERDRLEFHYERQII